MTYICNNFITNAILQLYGKHNFVLKYKCRKI